MVIFMRALTLTVLLTFVFLGMIQGQSVGGRKTNVRMEGKKAGR